MQMLASKPAAIRFEAAAACSTVFLTVDLAMWRSGAASSAGALLIHGATGGVGIAALDVARAAHIRAVGSAGSVAKRALLRRMGVAGAASSRGLAFATAAAVPDSTGFSLVLNSLTSAGFVAASLASLCAGGRMVEISKRDIWSARRVAQDRPDAGFSMVALDFLPPAAAGASLRRLAASLARGAHAPLGGATHRMMHVRAAMRQMSRAAHVGKLVLRRPVLSCAHQGGVVVSGGVGFLGLLTTAWLLQASVPCVLVSGRSGHMRLNSFPCCSFSGTVVFFRSDVASTSERLSAVLCPPLISAMLYVGGQLSDGVLANQGVAGGRRVFSPKSSGPRVFCGSLSQPMLFTAAFSSISSLLGNAGQANCAYTSRILTHCFAC
jgi:hypothetical protein